ncbi:MAG TPA: hypothetical protein VL156_16375 [Terriglobales bacterium]|jgi:hypothetical protein|nr:hypothetical protein [Terriglobales bacterium]
MKLRKLFVIALIGCGAAASLPAAEQKQSLSDNAALRYYAAFTVMQDSAISNEEASKLNRILEGTAPYDDSQYSGLVEKNAVALRLLQLGASHAECDWGLDYQLGEQTPVEYARNALQLGRLNVLYAFHLSITGNKDGAAKVLSAGIRYSRQVANGGSLFATLVSKQLLLEHLRAVEGLNHLAHLSEGQRSLLRKEINAISLHGLDWGAALTREFELVTRPETQAEVSQISAKYLRALVYPATLPELEASIARSPIQLQQLVPAPKRVLEQKQELQIELQKAGEALRR